MSRESGIGNRESSARSAESPDARTASRLSASADEIARLNDLNSGRTAGAEGAPPSPIPDSRFPIPDSQFPILDHPLSRRQAIALTATAVALPALDWTDAQAQRAAQLVRQTAPAAALQAPTFFSTDEWEIVRILADYVIPRDAKSGSATDAGVPEFMDHMMSDPEASASSQLAMRGGLAWLDTESRRRFGAGFVASSDAQRRAILDDIAWPKRARPEMSHGVAFFNRFRDLTASGFFSSAIGYQDLDFRGNTFVAEWTGCPPEALAKLGVRYE